MGDGFSVAAKDLRDFSSTLHRSGEAAGKLETKAAETKLDYWFPVVGLAYKSDFNDARQEVFDALKLFHDNLITASQKLTSVANSYEKAEQANAGH